MRNETLTDVFRLKGEVERRGVLEQDVCCTLHIYIYTHTHTCVCVCVCVFVCVRIKMYVCKYIYYVHTYIIYYIFTHTHTHTHTCIKQFQCVHMLQVNSCMQRYEGETHAG